MPPSPTQSLAQDLLATRSSEARSMLLHSRMDVLKSAPWDEMKDSGLPEALLEVAVTAIVVSPIAISNVPRMTVGTEVRSLCQTVQSGRSSPVAAHAGYPGHTVVGDTTTSEFNQIHQTRLPNTTFPQNPS